MAIAMPSTAVGAPPRTPPRRVAVSALAACTPLDLLRLQAFDSPPRGLLLVIGCIGVLIGLSEVMPGWDGCKRILKGQRAAAPSRQEQRRSKLQAAGAAVQQGRNFWQLLEAFDVSDVLPMQREMVLTAIRGDVGGLMMPHHLEQVSTAAAALGAWVQAVEKLLRAPPSPRAASAEPPSASSSSLFEAPRIAVCPVCGTRLLATGLAEHEVLCTARQRERAPAVEPARLGVPTGMRPMISEEEAAATARLARERVQPLRLSDAPFPPPTVPRPAPPPPPPAAPPPAVPPPAAPPPPPSPERVAFEEPVEEPPLPPALPEGGFDYLRARTGHAGLALSVMCDAESGCGGGSSLASPRSSQWRQRTPVLNGRRATGSEPTARAAEDRAAAAAKLLLRGGSSKGAPRGRRAKPRADDDDDDGEPAVVLTHEAHVAAIRRTLESSSFNR